MICVMISPMSVIYCYRGILYFGSLAILSSGYFSLARGNALSVDVLSLIARSTGIFAFVCIVSSFHYIALAIVFRKKRTFRYTRLANAVIFLIFSIFALFQSQFFLTFGVGSNV